MNKLTVNFKENPLYRQRASKKYMHNIMRIYFPNHNIVLFIFMVIGPFATMPIDYYLYTKFGIENGYEVPVSATITSWYLLVVIIYYCLVRYYFHKKKILKGYVSTTIDNGGINQTADHSRLRINWTGITDIDVNSDRIDFVADYYIIFVPFEAFSSSKEKNDFVELARRYWDASRKLPAVSSPQLNPVHRS